MSVEPVAKLLVVDDETAQMKALCSTLEHDGYAPAGFTSAREALKALAEQPFELVLTDLMMPEMDGITLLRRALELDGNLAGVVMTGHGTIDTAVEAMKAGAVDYILKPFKLSEVRHVLARSLAARRLRMENTQLREVVAIYELSSAVAFTQDFQTILQKLADAAFHQSHAAAVSILLPARGRQELRVAAARGADALPEGQCIPIAEALSAWVARAREALSKPDGAMDVQTTFAPPFRELPRGIAVPMLSGGTLVGVLNFVPPEHLRRVAPGQVRALNILASTAAAALEAASLLEQLRAAEQRYRRLAENAPDVIFRYDLQPRPGFSFVNPRVTDLFGYAPDDYYRDPDLAFKTVHPEDRSRLEAILSGASPDDISTLRLLHKDGSVVSVEQHHVVVRDASGRPLAIEGIGRDVTERKRLEEQLRQAQKMEAVGRLAGGIAHDFNNLLTVINGYSSQVLEGLNAADPLYADVQEISKAGVRAASLTRQLLAFSRRQVLTPETLDLNLIVEDMDRMLRRVMREDVQLATALDPALGSVHADRGQLEQVIMNLAVNARDAMPKGGRLLIETANAELDDAYAREHRAVTPGHYVMLAVSDEGVGMDAQTQARIFEPFFTTKAAGQGTGLGLATVYGIVQQSGGHIWVYSEPGKGTTFKVYLPRSAAARKAARRVPAAAMHRGSGTILVVEDEEGVRKLIHSVLTRAGYTVLEARHGEEALRQCASHQGPVDLVITDVVMPQMSGRELAERLGAQQPGIKLLFMSGYTDGGVVQHGRIEPEEAFLQKPFTPAALASKVQEALA